MTAIRALIRDFDAAFGPGASRAEALRFIPVGLGALALLLGLAVIGGN